MTEQHFTLPSAVSLVLQHEGKILLMRRANTAWHNGYYDLPSGRIAGGEANTSAAVRLAKELLGIDMDPSALEFALLTHGLYADGKEGYNVYFRAPTWQGEPKPTDPSRFDAVEWFAFDALPENLTPGTQLGLEVVRGGIPYVEFGFPELGSVSGA